MTDAAYSRLAAIAGLARPPARVPLGAWPTPVRRLPQLAPDLWVKCDHESNAIFGGNKVRKLELLLADAQAKGARSLLTVGGIGSHQITATALFASAIGASCGAVVTPAPVTAWSRVNAALWARAKAKLVVADDPAALEGAVETMRAQLAEPIYSVPAGGSSPLGNLGHVAAAFELAAQIEAGEMPAPQEIFVACGTGGTVAGLALGLGLARVRATIVAVRASSDVGSLASVRQQMTAMTKLVERLGGKLPPIEEPSLTILEASAPYGVETDDARAAIERARAEGLELEPTYTGRVLARAFARNPGGPTLFWHTGNTLSPASAAADDPIPAEVERHFRAC